MGRVQEELYISLIFVGKWLGLGLGVVGLLYFTIHLAYQESYYKPKVEGFNLEISKLQKDIVGLEATNQSLTSVVANHKLEIDKISQRLTKANEALGHASEKLDEARGPIANKVKFWRKKSKNERDAEQELTLESDEVSKLQAIHNRLTESIEGLEKKLRENKEQITKLKNKVSEKVIKREEVGTGILGIMPWVLSLLGFAF